MNLIRSIIVGLTLHYVYDIWLSIFIADAKFKKKLRFPQRLSAEIFDIST